jgi:hypothetical protein
MMASSNSIQGGRSGWGLAPGRRWEGMLAGIVVGLLVLSACSGSSKYFHDAVNEATQEMVGKRYGSPHKTQAATGGGEIWTYFERGSGNGRLRWSSAGRRLPGLCLDVRQAGGLARLGTATLPGITLQLIDPGSSRAVFAS